MDLLERYAEQLGALGHPARLTILRHVVQAGPKGVNTTELQGKVAIPWTTLNHHLDRLVSSNLVKAKREGRAALHTADFGELRALTDFLWRECCSGGRNKT